MRWENIVISLIISLVLTLVLEIVFFLARAILPNVLRKQKCHFKWNKKDLLLVVMVNILTNPVVVLLYWLTVMYRDWNIYLTMIPLELFAIVTEGYYYKKYGSGFNRPYLFSITANMFSFWLGVVIQQFI